MTLKSVGLILCALALSGGGWLAGEKFKKGMKDLTFMKELILHLKREICFSRTELPQCFLNFDTDDYKAVVTALALGNVEEAMKKLNLEKSLTEALIRFFRTLGKDSANAEELRINKFLDFLEQEEKKMSSALTGKVKSAKVLGICLGASLLLLFL